MLLETPASQAERSAGSTEDRAELGRLIAPVVRCERPALGRGATRRFWIGAVAVDTAPAAGCGTPTRGPETAPVKDDVVALPRPSCSLRAPSTHVVHAAQENEAFDPVRVGSNLCPQRDSNPRCRLESAKLGISRTLPRSFAIDRNLLPLGQTARSGIVGSLQRFPPFCGGVRPPRSLDLGLMCDHTVSRLAATPGSHTGLWTISRLRPRAYFALAPIAKS